MGGVGWRGGRWDLHGECDRQVHFYDNETLMRYVRI